PARLLVSTRSHRTPRPTLFPYTTLFRSHARLRPSRSCKNKGRSASAPKNPEPMLTSAQSIASNPSHQRAENVSRSNPSIPSKERSEEHTSELQSRGHLVCRLLLEKKKKN